MFFPVGNVPVDPVGLFFLEIIGFFIWVGFWTITIGRWMWESVQAVWKSFVGVMAPTTTYGLPKEEFTTIKDSFKSVDEIKKELRKLGLESSNLIIGIDYTQSNETQGARTLGGNSLHFIDPYRRQENPYQRIIGTLGRTLAEMDEDGIIPCFGFGDLSTKNKSVIPILSETGSYCFGFEQVIESYNRITPTLKLAGPTSFAPIIYKAIEIVKQKNEFHILIVITDGQVSGSDYESTVNAIVKATSYPLSIIVIGVGDGPWDNMEEFDDKLPERRFDNFQFVDYHKWLREDGADEDFKLKAMMELPEQYAAMQKLKLL